MKILCTICARGGSQGVKNKNIRSLLGKPLIAHTILQAKSSGLFDMIIVSSDSEKIRSIAKKWGADLTIERPNELATATAAKLPVIQHAVLATEKITQNSFDIIVDLDATSPLRAVIDIQNSLHSFLEDKNAENLVTAFPSRHSPYFNMLEITGANFVKLVKEIKTPVTRRQDAPNCYDMNASIYIWKKETLFKKNHIINDKTILYIMPEERSIDIDSPLDFQLVKLLAKKRTDLF